MANRKTRNSGMTLVELMITVVIVTVAILGIGGVMAGAHRDYSRVFKRVHGVVTTDSYTARLAFDRVCRKARAGTALIDTSVPSLEVWYYSTPNVNGSAYLDPDMFARFSLSGTNLVLERGPIGTTNPPVILARNVSELKFSYPNPNDSKSVQMVMTLDDTAVASPNGHSITITCGSIMHN